jgi:hypothetical protein
MTKLFKFSSNLMVFLDCALLLLLPGPVLGQTATVPVRDLNAVALANRALQAMAGITALKDITLQANATYIAGSDQETGTATLIALGNQQSLVTLNLSGGQRQEIRDGVAGVQVNPDGIPHNMAVHNCWADASWFYPGLSLAALAIDPTLAIAVVGKELHAGSLTYHLILYHVVGGQRPTIAADIQQLSAMDLYLDAGSLLPVALAFNTHPEDNAGADIAVEVRLGAYSRFNGAQVPTRIQKYLQGTLVLDFTVTNVAVNSGVPAGLFTLPAVLVGGAQ